MVHYHPCVCLSPQQTHGACSGWGWLDGGAVRMGWWKKSWGTGQRWRLCGKMQQRIKQPYKEPRVATATLLADERLQRLLHLRTRGMLPEDGLLWRTGGTGGWQWQGQWRQQQQGQQRKQGGWWQGQQGQWQKLPRGRRETMDTTIN